MASSDYIRSDLLKIIPGQIILQNFIPGRLYKESLTIYNTATIPMLLNLRSSDKSKLIINKSFLKIPVNSSEKISLVIQDKINYVKNKLPSTPKKLFIHLTGELIDYKFEITLMYFCNVNTTNNNFINVSPSQEINKNENNNTNLKEVPSSYFKMNNIYNKEGKKNDKKIIQKVQNLFVKGYGNDEVNKLNEVINDLVQKNSMYKKISEEATLEKNNNIGNNMNFNSNDDDIEKRAIIAHNKILVVENSVLTNRIKYLESKLMECQSKCNNMIEGNEEGDDSDF